LKEVETKNLQFKRGTEMTRRPSLKDHRKPHSHSHPLHRVGKRQPAETVSIWAELSRKWFRNPGN
jgi:hypothetical protein